MNEIQNSSACERGSDLIAFVYNEASESEIRDFELHVKECRDCREEVASFGIVRESIVGWRDKALSGLAVQPLTVTAGKKSALAAFRQFFDLSPLWLKAATGFAVLSFCVLAALAFRTAPTKEPVMAISKPEQPQEVVQIVKEPADVSVEQEQNSKPRITRTKANARHQRPLSRTERDQLAADLRLTADNSLDLLSDRINQ